MRTNRKGKIKKKEDKKKKESVRREIDRLTDSLDFEPVNFYEVMARIILFPKIGNMAPMGNLPEYLISVLPVNDKAAILAM